MILNLKDRIKLKGVYYEVVGDANGNETNPHLWDYILFDLTTGEIKRVLRKDLENAEKISE